ncbi:hypothetical protein NOC27_2094 [Nitrosococcus oceani AFC27]|nr:hypothetical protein NOC27_2094 [Nitrosococcus oceani AFC27]
MVLVVYRNLALSVIEPFARRFDNLQQLVHIHDLTQAMQ